MDLFDAITYSFHLLCVDGVRLCVNRLRDLQGFELCVGITFMVYHWGKKTAKQTNEMMTLFYSHQLNICFSLTLPSSKLFRQEVISEKIIKVTR